MFKKVWFGWNSKPRNPHSLEHLKYLYTLLSKNQVVSEQNKNLLVETLRLIAEILIWGDQNDSTVFDFFLEKNMLSFFLKIMKQKCGSYVCVQLLQTLNILFENIRNETSLYYLLSNNHVNSIIVHKFDFSDEEVMAYYISFLKTLSLKLNSHTIHFFFNEHTNDFPLYTEAIKFFNHNEKMVRIAVRTLTLNVFKVDEKSMLKFIGDRTAAPYFSNLVWFIGNNVLEIDSCLDKNVKDHQMLIRLDDLVAEHLDHLHYLNDILLLRIDDLNNILSDHLLNRLLIPLYVYSLVKDLSEDEPRNPRPRISIIVSLFLLSQVFLIISYETLVQKLVNIIFSGNITIFDKPEFTAPPETLEESLIQAAKGPPSPTKSEDEDGNKSDGKDNQYNDDIMEESNAINDTEIDEISIVINPVDINKSSLTDEEKAAATMNLTTQYNSHGKPKERLFLELLFNALDCGNKSDDHTCIFALCLLYAIVFNPGVKEFQLSNLIIKAETVQNDEPLKSMDSTKLIDHLTDIMHSCCQYNNRIRLITLEMSIILLKKLVMREDKSVISDHHLAEIEQAKEEATLILRNFCKSEEEVLFLDMFEEEYNEVQKRQLNVEYLMMDSNLLLPPSQLTQLMMNGFEFARRLPCADIERTRYAIRVFFLLRNLSLTLRGETEAQLPLTNYDTCVKIDQLLDLNNSDLIACTVVMKDQPKMRRFMVIDAQQLILIEPDTRRLGWGIAKFVAFLQDVEVNPDKDDSRSLYITIRQATANVKRIILSAKFVFDDHIRCMAAKQRLTKGRLKARQRKMLLIAKLIEMTTQTDNSQPSSRRTSAVSSSGRDMPRSQSQHDGIAKRPHTHHNQNHSHHNHNHSQSHHNHTGNHHRPLCRGPAVPGFAVAESSSKSNQLKPTSQQRRRSASSSTSSAQSAQGAHNRDSSPHIVVPNEEMIPMEDLSPKNSRRRSRSRSEQRGDKRLTVSDDCERV